jgi:phosphate transport system substrate-binding protein
VTHNTSVRSALTALLVGVVAVQTLQAQSPRRTDINDASRPIKPAELSRAAQLGVQFIELPIGFDGIAVVVNPQNDFCDHLTVAELKRIWEPGSKIRNWKDVRSGFPDLELRLYGPGTDSGTFDYFIETIVGKAKAARSDFTASEDDNVLVQGVAGDRGGLGYFGFSYYAENVDRLKLLGIDPGNGKRVRPSIDTIAAGTYTPLSRPLFMYVNTRSLERPAVRAFLEFTIQNAPRIVQHPRVNYVALDRDLYDDIWARVENRVTGSEYAKPENRGKSIRALFGDGPE